MDDLRILYVHGYMGHGNGPSSQLIRAELDKRGISYTLDAPELPVTDPAKMKTILDGLTASGSYDFAIGSSLGALYVMQLSGPDKILINPALPEDLKAIRESEQAEDQPWVSDENIEKLKKNVDLFFEVYYDNWKAARTYIVYGDRDKTVGNEPFFRRYYHDEQHVFHVDMEHKLDRTGAEKVRDIIEKYEKGRKAFDDFIEERDKTHDERFARFIEEHPEIFDKNKAEKTVLGVPVEAFIAENADKTLGEVFWRDPAWYFDCGIESLRLGTRAYNCLHRYMDPPLIAPSGARCTLDELLEMTVKELRGVLNLGEDCFIEIVEKTKAWIETY